MRYFVGFVFAVVLAIGGFAACGGGNEDAGNGGADPVYEVSVQPVEEQFVKTVTLECTTQTGATEDCDWQIPVNHLVAMFDGELSFEEARQSADGAVDALVAAGITASRVGQVPVINLFQFEIENEASDPDQALARLREAQTVIEASEGIENVAFNFLGHVRHAPIEPTADDNANFGNEKRIGLAATDYFQAVPVFDELFGPGELSEVVVGVLDTGIFLTSDQFDNVTVTAVFDPVDDFSPRIHGTNIAALIAADSGDGQINGVASRILGDRLSLVVGKVGAIEVQGTFEAAHAQSMANLALMLAHRPDVMNMSFGFGEELGDGEVFLSDFAEAREQWETILRTNSDVLFVAASMNHPIRLTYTNDFPAGIDLPNVITVGGVDSQGLYNRAGHSAFGEPIDLAGPSTHVALLAFPEASVREDFGNSYATAYVTSMAAVMKSINPRATAAEIKAFLTDPENGWPAFPNVGGTRPSLLRTVGAFAIYQQVGGATELLDTLAPADQQPDPIGLIMNRFASQSVTNLSINGPTSSTQTLTGDDTDWLSGPGSAFNNVGAFVEGLTQFVADAGGYTVNFWSESRFGLNTPDNAAIIRLSRGPMLSPEYVGIDETGGLVYTGCELTTRSLPLNWDILGHGADDGIHARTFVQVEGAFSATVIGTDISTNPPITDVSYVVEGTFNTAFELLGASSAVRTTLEQSCVGGYQYSP